MPFSVPTETQPQPPIFYPTARVICDSISDEGHRIITMVVETHYSCLQEFARHRWFSFNTGSSRAIPAKRLIEQVKNVWVQPLEWQYNQPGMQGIKMTNAHEIAQAEAAWNVARARALDVAEHMVDLNLHKQIVNEILKPFMTVRLIVTGTQAAYDHFYGLRLQSDVKPDLRAAARAMFDAHEVSIPVRRAAGEWHLPYYSDELSVLSERDCAMVCAARCARISYHREDSKHTIDEDLALAGRLALARHASPFEHIAVVCDSLPPLSYGNFHGSNWLQLRKILEGSGFSQKIT